ncbi:MAG TPA: DUF1559 domain-containing protein [Pirellulales bacterium]|nr:DUF1559 domain-containing protein [Pirellulales bacterium]
MEPFAIVCPTCNARLKVRDATAIGQILNCPKCGSMVQVTAPADWQPGATGAASAPTQPSAATPPPASTPPQPQRRWENQVQPGEKVTGAAPASASSGSWRLGSSSGAISSPDLSSPAEAEPVAAMSDEMPEGRRWNFVPASLTPYLWSGNAKWLLLLVGPPALAIVAVTSVWLARRSTPVADVTEQVVESVPAESAEIAPPPAEVNASEPDKASDPEPVRVSRRWLPTDAQAVVSLRPKILSSQPASMVVLGRTAALWQPTIDKLASALVIDVPSLERITWSSTDATASSDNGLLGNGVMTLELGDLAGNDLRGIKDSEPLDWTLAGSPARTLKSRAWPNPFAIVDEHLLVTGPEEQLRELSARTEHRLANEALERLIDSLDAEHSAVAVVDLRAIKETAPLAGALPVVELLHADAEDWKLLSAVPLALGISCGVDQRLELEIDLACEGDSSSEQVQTALERVLKAIEETVGGETDRLTAKLLAGQINTAAAGDLRQFLAGSKSALAGRSSGVRDSIVWTRLNWQGDLSKLAAGFLASVPQLEASRLAAARALDEEHQQLLLAGLQGYLKAEASFPAGAAGASLLPPDTRLSWQATLLPYYGRLDWHGELNFARAWNDPANQRVTRRPLDLMVNPALGPSTATGGFPVTHYVGVAGLGADAAELDADDPRAGVFGFRPRALPGRGSDGASNTIALAGVSQKLGPWGRGGAATVRGLTQRPYIDGPDGFGSGQPEGMLVGMADGSVRFLPKSIDPEVLERLVTIGGDARREPLASSGKPTVEAMPPEAAREAAPSQPKRKPPKGALAARLTERIPSIEFKSTTLSELVELLSQLSTVPITLDSNGLAAAGVEPDARVSLTLTDATIGEILDEALRPYRLKYLEVGEQLIVTDSRQPAENLESTRFQIADLSAPGSDEARLAQLIETFVVPAAWQAAGGAGSIKAAERELAVEQTPAVIKQVADFLDKLRMARELPITRREGRRLSLASRWARAQEKLAEPVTANFAEPAPLTEIAAHLQKGVGIEIVFDGLGLAEAGIAATERTKFSCDRQPLGRALDSLLEPLELGYRVLSGKRIEITSAHVVAEQPELEFFSVKALLQSGDDAEEFAARLRKEVAPSSWREHGGMAALAIDGVSSYLLVLAPQPVQVELERWLEERAAR